MRFSSELSTHQLRTSSLGRLSRCLGLPSAAGRACGSCLRCCWCHLFVLVRVPHLCLCLVQVLVAESSQNFIDPCATFNYGGVKDFSVDIIGGLPPLPPTAEPAPTLPPGHHSEVARNAGVMQLVVWLCFQFLCVPPEPFMDVGFLACATDLFRRDWWHRRLLLGWQFLYEALACQRE
jgi:hypothetical protein